MSFEVDDPAFNAAMFKNDAPCTTERLNLCIALSEPFTNWRGATVGATFTPECKAFIARCKAEKRSVDPGAYRRYLEEEEEIWNASMALVVNLPVKELCFEMTTTYTGGEARDKENWTEIKTWDREKITHSNSGVVLGFSVNVRSEGAKWQVEWNLDKKYGNLYHTIEPYQVRNFKSEVDARRFFFDQVERYIPFIDPQSATVKVRHGHDEIEDGWLIGWKELSSQRLLEGVRKLITNFKPTNGACLSV